MYQKIYEYIERNYADKTNRQICDESGLPYYMVWDYARKAGLKKSPRIVALERARRAEAARRMLTGVKRKKAVREKISATLRRTVAEERQRLANGEPLKTNIRLSLLPDRTRQLKWRLVTGRRYIRGDEENVLYYDGGTRRCTGRKYNEDYYEHTYHLHFKPAPNSTIDTQQ